MLNKAISSPKVVIDGNIAPATIFFSTDSGKIIYIHPEIIESSDDPLLAKYDITQYEKTKFTILPGLVDSHVHLNEPGRTEWEGFETGTKAAISGGVTTIVDMPLNAVPPTTTVKNFNLKLKASKNQLWCDVGFWGGLIPTNINDLKPLINCGVLGFKGFLSPSGVQEFPKIDSAYIDQVMQVLNDTNTLLLFHAELEDGNDKLSENQNNPTNYDTFLQSRPQSFEVNAIDAVVKCIQKNINPEVSPLKVHIVHLDSEKALPKVKEAKLKSLPLTAETCFHYLAFNSAEIKDKATHFKCCPPIRKEKNRQALWSAIQDGTITTVVSDHSPCTPELKDLEGGDFLSTWGGVASVGLNLPVLFTFGKKLAVPLTLPDIVRLCCENTAKQIGFHDRKGFIKVGYDADLIFFNENDNRTIIKEELEFKNKLTPYEGLKLDGVVTKVFLRGKVAFTDIDGPTPQAIGRPLLEKRCI